MYISASGIKKMLEMLTDLIREGQGSYYFRNGDVFTGGFKIMNAEYIQIFTGVNIR